MGAVSIPLSSATTPAGIPIEEVVTGAKPLQSNDLSEGSSSSALVGLLGEEKSTQWVALDWPNEKVMMTLDPVVETLGEWSSQMGIFCRNPEFRVDTCGELLCDVVERILFNKGSRKLEELNLDEQDELIASSDPSRLPPRIYLRIPRCIEAIEKEINAMAKPDVRGIPSLAVIHLKDPRYLKLSKTHSTLVVKKKTIINESEIMHSAVMRYRIKASTIPARRHPVESL